LPPSRSMIYRGCAVFGAEGDAAWQRFRLQQRLFGRRMF
jgi:hypothetical protein